MELLQPYISFYGVVITVYAVITTLLLPFKPTIVRITSNEFWVNNGKINSFQIFIST
jgi:hypothetical protein